MVSVVEAFALGGDNLRFFADVTQLDRRQTAVFLTGLRRRFLRNLLKTAGCLHQRVTSDWHIEDLAGPSNKKIGSP